MKNLFTLVFVCLTFALAAQTSTFESAKSLVDENAVASLNFDLAFLPEIADRDEEVEVEELEEVENHFNIKFSTNSTFADVKIIYNVATSSDVTIEVVKNDVVVFTTTKSQGAGQQQVLWNKDITRGTHTIRVIADNKVEAKRINIRR